MSRHSHYVMHDQVRGLIPDLMKYDSRGGRRPGGSFLELLIFIGAVILYLAALGFSY